MRRSALTCLAALGIAISAARASADELPVARASVSPRPGTFLVAQRGMADPRFRRTVILMLRYGKDGALGLIVNRPTRIGLSHLLEPPDGPSSDDDAEPNGPSDPPVHVGGPVMRHVGLALVRAPTAPDESSHVVEDLYMTSSREVLEALVSGAVEADRFRVYLGHSGWGAGQLDRELARGDWLVVPGDLDRTFEPNLDGLWADLIGEPDPTDGPTPPGAQWTHTLLRMRPT